MIDERNFDPRMVAARHGLFRACPFTGKPVPGPVTWTIRARPGSDNACAACADPRLVPTLQELNDAREAK